MNKKQSKPKSSHLTSSDEDDESFSSARSESERTIDSDDDDDDYSLGKLKYRPKLNESTVKSDESINDFPLNNYVRKKKTNRIIDSDDSDESDKENGGSLQSRTDASSEFDGERSRSNNGTGGSNVLVDESFDLHSASTSTHNSKFEESIIVPDTDDEEDERMLQETYMSPRTRRSITGRRSIVPGRLSMAPTTSDIVENSDDIDDDVFKISSADSKSDDGLPDAAVELSSVRLDSFGVNVDPSNSAEGSSNGAVKSDTDFIVDSTNSDDESNGKHSRSSIIDLDSDDSDDDYVPDIKDVSDFGRSTTTSTPGPLKKWIQPKLQNAMKLTKYVSKEVYEHKERQLNVARVELTESMDLYDEMKAKLSDNGAKLLQSCETLKCKIEQMENELAELKIQENVVAVDDWRSGLSQIQPKHTGKVGLKTHNTQKALTINRLEKLHKALHLCPGDDELAKPPPYLKVSLMPHQLHAIKWMRWRERQKPKGGLLADDMGLGKTLTVIALVLDTVYGDDDDADDKENEYNSEQTDSDSDDDFDDDVNRVHKKKSQKNGGTLIVCPASLVNQWNHEIQTRVKRNKLITLMHHGNNRKSNLNLICKNDIVMTTYGVISSEYKSNGALFRIKWDRLVLDEAHMIRNHNTAMATAASALRSNIRWGLTGTPIQNKAMDVYSMLKYLRVSPFDDLQTFMKFSDPRSAEGLSRLHNILKPLLLRRTKGELQIKGELDALPAKTINIERVDFNRDESTVYLHVLTYSQQVFMQYAAQHQAKVAGFMGDTPFVLSDDIRRRLDKIKNKPFDNDVKASHILVLMLRLRQICDHPGLIKSMLNDDDDLDAEEINENNSVDINMMKALIGLDMNDTEADAVKGTDDVDKLHNVLSKYNPVFNLNNPSSKCKRVIEMAQRILKDTDDKMVIVSQWTSVLNIVADQLQRKSIDFVELTGKTPIKSRNDIVVNFNQSRTSRERVMLLSLVAGGVGLNLTGANHLFLLDPHWNPQLESQAFDRVYRVGQKKDVQIYKIVCNNTIENRIIDIQNKKQELSDNVLTGSKMNSGSKLSFQDMCALFEMGGP